MAAVLFQKCAQNWAYNRKADLWRRRLRLKAGLEQKWYTHHWSGSAQYWFVHWALALAMVQMFMFYLFLSKKKEETNDNRQDDKKLYTHFIFCWFLIVLECVWFHMEIVVGNLNRALRAISQMGLAGTAKRWLSVWKTDKHIRRQYVNVIYKKLRTWSSATNVAMINISLRNETGEINCKWLIIMDARQTGYKENLMTW